MFHVEINFIRELYEKVIFKFQFKTKKKMKIPICLPLMCETGFFFSMRKEKHIMYKTESKVFISFFPLKKN